MLGIVFYIKLWTVNFLLRKCVPQLPRFLKKNSDLLNRHPVCFVNVNQTCRFCDGYSRTASKVFKYILFL